MIRFLVLALLSFPVFAAPVSFQLNEVRLVDLVRVVYTDVLKRSFVLDSDLLANQDVVSLHLRAVDPLEVERRIIALLDAREMSVVEAGGVSVVGKRKAPEELKQVLVYRPSYRPVSYLLDLVQSLFPAGSFSGQRSIHQQASPVLGQVAPVVQNVRQQGGQGVAGAPVVDTGTNAFSRIDKGEQDAIVFHGTSKDAAKLASLLRQLDKAAGEVVIKAVVYEVRTDQREGNALKVAGGILKSNFGIVIDTGELSQNAIKIKAGDFTAIYSALNSDGRFKLVSSPTMRVKSGGNARFVAGAEVPVLGNVTYPQGGQAVQSVEYKPSGVILDVRPHVREAVTDLSINQQISSFVATTTGLNQTPTLLKRELKTEITTTDGEIIVLGGLEENQDTDESAGLPFLPDFLRAKGEGRQRTEIMVVLDARRI